MTAILRERLGKPGILIERFDVLDQRRFGRCAHHGSGPFGRRVKAGALLRTYTRETLPRPNDPAVVIVTVSEETYAVLRFSGSRSDPRLATLYQEAAAQAATTGELGMVR